jgi:predicted dehydrogenase
VTESTLNIGLLGCGFFGRALAGGIAAIPGARIHAVADVSMDAAVATGAALSAVVMSPEALLASDDIDAVLIATPNDLHREPVLAACAAGKHVFVEKPMALSPADCADMIAAADAAGVKLVVGHILRTLPASLRLKGMLETNALGRLSAAEGSLARWVRPTESPADWWKKDPSRTGGELLHEIHILDLLCWLLGEVDEVTGFSNQELTQLVMRSGSVLASYELSKVARIPSWGLTLHGSLASAELDLRAGTLTIVSDSGSEVTGVYDEPAANASLREFATKPQGYNHAGSEPDLWMQRAIEIELAEAVRVFCGATASPLLEAPVRAVDVADRLLARRS